jgi:hypothetical protein
VITAVTPVLPAVSDTATFHYVPLAARIIAVSGDAQSGLIGTAFGLPLIVEVQDAGGAPYRGGYPVTFGVASGPTGTSVAPTTVNTDLTGRAQTVLTAGSAVGTLSVTATATGLTGSPLTFNGTVTTGGPGVPTTVAVAGGNNQSDSLNHVLANPLVVLVSDQFGNPVSGVTVSWTASDGSLSAPTSNTNTSGQASINWTLGSAQASPTVTATVSGLTPVVFTATTLFPGPQILISQAGVPGVGIGLTATINVALSGPAGAGGVAVALASSQTSIFTVVPSTLNIPQGASAGTATITGVSSGIATLTGTATGYIAGSLRVDVR